MITRRDISKAYEKIAPHIRTTPVVDYDGVTFKLEFLQQTGSFKARGALANVLLRDVPKAGVAAASGGNHGIAVAFAAQKSGVPASIFVPKDAPAAKKARIKEYGAKLNDRWTQYDDAYNACEKFIAESGAMGIHAYDQRETMMGAGTIALELSRQAKNIDTILVSVGGGGLAAGIATWYAGKVKVIGVEPRLAPTLNAALKAGAPVEVVPRSIANDSLGASWVGEEPFPIAQKYVDSVLVTDADIRNAQRELWKRYRIAAEAGGATAYAALLSKRYVPRKGERVAVVLCGANTDAVAFPR
jgi:threonine dehydratase